MAHRVKPYSVFASPTAISLYAHALLTHGLGVGTVIFFAQGEWFSVP